MSNNIIVNYTKYDTEIQDVRVNIDTDKYQTYRLVDIVVDGKPEKHLQVLTRDLASPYITTFNMTKLDVKEMIKILTEMTKQF